MGAGWNPWRALRERDRIDFRLAPLPYGLGAVYWPRGQRALIVIDPALDRQHRNEALAHELVHDERGGGVATDGMPDNWCDMATRDENQVQHEVARRLLPLGELEAWVRARVLEGEEVTAWGVAEEFDVTDELAMVALHLLPPIP